MIYKYDENLIPYAQRLRKEMTKEEKHLWYDFLAEYPVKFTRQKILGKYIADFYCATVSLVIEVDGVQHKMRDATEYDEERTKFLNEYGITVIRISNEAINNDFYNMCSYIDRTVKSLLDKK